MKNLKLSAFVLLAAVVISACGGSKPTVADSNLKPIAAGPKWFQSEADNENFLFTYSTATSTRQETARQKAYVNASGDMARKLNVKVEALQKMFNEEITSGSQTNFDEAFTNATKTIASERLVGLAQHNVEFFQDEKGMFVCYIALKLPVGDAKATLENNLSKNQELWVKFKESKAFDELQKDISRVGSN